MERPIDYRSSSPPSRPTTTPSQRTSAKFRRTVHISQDYNVDGKQRNKDHHNDINNVYITQYDSQRSRDEQDSDCETELADVDARAYRSYNQNDLVKSAYLKRCKALGVTPISYFIRHVEDPELCLRNYSCGPVGARALALPLMVSTTLTKLDLGNNGLGPEGAAAIAEMLQDNTYISDLGLANNDLGALGIKRICRVLLNSTFVHRVDLSGNHGGEKSVEYIAKVLQESRFLFELNISNNQLGEAAGVTLGPVIGSNEVLEIFDISYNHIRLHGASALAKGIKENVRLKNLNLSWNGLGDEGIVAMGDAIGQNDALIELNLSSTRMTDQSLAQFSKGLMKNSDLQVLRLGDNPVSPAGAFALITALKHNPNTGIRFLDLKMIVVLEDFVQVLDEIQKNKSIEVIYERMTRRKLKPYSKDSNRPSVVADAMALFLAYLVQTNITPQNLFSLIQPDGNGRISRDVFRNIIKSHSIPLLEDQIEDILHLLDERDSGYIHLKDLYDLQGAKMKAESSSQLVPNKNINNSLDTVTVASETDSIAPTS